MNLRAFAASDPLSLQRARHVGPIDEREIFEQTIGIRRDAEHPLLERHAKHGEAAALTASVDDLFVRKHGAEFRTPIHRLRAEIREAERVEIGLFFALRARRPLLRCCVLDCDRGVFACESRFEFCDRSRLLDRRIKPRCIRLQPNPLRPLVVVGIDRREFTRPVVHKTESPELPTEVVDRLLRCHFRVYARLNRVLLCWKAERVPTHWMEHIEALELLVATDDVGRRVALRMSDVEARTRRIREHVEAIELRLRGVEAGLVRVRLSVAV